MKIGYRDIPDPPKVKGEWLPGFLEARKEREQEVIYWVAECLDEEFRDDYIGSFVRKLAKAIE